MTSSNQAASGAKVTATPAQLSKSGSSRSGFKALPAPDPQAVVYLRVSSKRQMDTAADIDPEGNSIATQRELCLAKAHDMGAAVVKEFVEPGNSAQTIEKRPVFRELLAYLTDNPHIDYVIIYMRSRAFRNLGDAVLTKRRLERMEIKLVSAKEDFGEGIMADAMEAENGGTIGRARLGYKNIRIEHDGRLVNTIGLDEERASLVRTAWELYATGEYSIERLYATMADLGLTTRPSRRTPAQPLAASQLHRMLRDPYYTGVVVYKGDIYPGRHPAIISHELFDRVQQVMDQRSLSGQRDRVLFHYLKGLLFCERCRKAGRTSRLIYVEAKGRGGTFPYYLCRGRQDRACNLPYLPVALVEEAVARYYGGVQLGEDFLAETAALIEEVMREEQQTIRDLHDSYRKQLRALDVREERLLDLATDAKLPRDKIHARLRRIQIDRERAEEGLKETGQQLAVGAEVLQTYLRMLHQPAQLYRHATNDGRRDLNQAFFERLYLDDHNVVDAVLTDALIELSAANQRYSESRANASGMADTARGPGNEARSSGESHSVVLADVFSALGSSKTNMVGVTGFEPATSSSRTPQSPFRALFTLVRTHLDEAERVKRCGCCCTLQPYFWSVGLDRRPEQSDGLAVEAQDWSLNAWTVRRGLGQAIRSGSQTAHFPSPPLAGPSVFRPHREAAIRVMAIDHEPC
jgi:site-specific DNA recombinase